MAESKKGHNFAIQGSTEKKKKCSPIFLLMLYIKFQVPSSSGSLVLQPTKDKKSKKGHNLVNISRNSLKS